jgi:transposase
MGNSDLRVASHRSSIEEFIMRYRQLFLGIDVSKLKHDIAIVNEQKLVVHKPLVIRENREDYQRLLDKLNWLRQKFATKIFWIGMEATSDYWKNIYHFLKKQSPDFHLTVINPFQTKKFAQSELRRAKTDPVNAKDIALFMLEKRPKPSIDRAPIFEHIKDLDRQIHLLTKQQTMARNKLRLELAKVAPEIEHVIQQLGGQQILAWLEKFPTAEAMAKASLKELCNVPYGKRRRLLPFDRAQKMQNLAQNSIAHKSGAGSGYVVQSLVRQIRQYQQEIQRLKRQMVELYAQVHNHDSLLTTITGISKENAIVLEAYIGDVNRFPDAKKVVAYFGMNPVVNLSGKVTKRASKLEKKGSGLVRHKLYMAVLQIVRLKEGALYKYYARLVASGKPKMVAIVATMRKLVVVIYVMLKNQQPFDPKRI